MEDLPFVELVIIVWIGRVLDFAVRAGGTQFVHQFLLVFLFQIAPGMDIGKSFSVIDEADEVGNIFIRHKKDFVLIDPVPVLIVLCSVLFEGRKDFLVDVVV